MCKCVYVTYVYRVLKSAVILTSLALLTVYYSTVDSSHINIQNNIYTTISLHNQEDIHPRRIGQENDGNGCVHGQNQVIIEHRICL
jgi:hypothetical protein